jgi:muconolactone delta-isomerase
VAKFLVIWQLDLALLSREMASAITRTPAYAAALERQGKIVSRYHIAGAHGGVWIVDVESHEELERLLGGMPAYNLTHFDVRPLSDMAE